jgi:hypothetical protein
MDRFSCARALDQLEAAGLISVLRKCGSSPLVTITGGNPAPSNDVPPVVALYPWTPAPQTGGFGAVKLQELVVPIAKIAARFQVAVSSVDSERTFGFGILRGGISPPLWSCRHADFVVPDGRLESLGYFRLADKPARTPERSRLGIRDLGMEPQNYGANRTD